MKKLFFTTVLLFLAAATSFPQSFEGVIEFRESRIADTIDRVYYIKGDKVRLDEIGKKSGKVEGSFIVNLKTNSMISISHDRKLFIEHGSGSPAIMNGKAEITKTKKTKKIHGYNCTEYIVKNTEDNTQITYWIANGKFDFFLKLLKVLNRKDKSVIYYQQLKGVEGMFPFLSSQVNLETGKEEVKMEVTKIQKKTLDTNLFEIPKDYQKFQK